MKMLLLLFIPFVAFAERNEVDDTATVTCAEGESCVGRQTPYRAQHVNLRDNSGNELLSVPVAETKRQTYSATKIFTLAASPTDVFTITGSASKTIKILSFTYSATKTANGFGNITLILRSAANTGGTSTTPTVAKYDSNNATGTAVVRAYTANPSALGATAGDIFSTRFFYSGLSVLADRLLLNFDNGTMQPITLRGTSQLLAVNMGGVTQAGNSVAASFTWSEE